MSEKVPRMSKEELRERLHEVVILDVRPEKDWNESDSMIQGARRETPTEAYRWMEMYPKDQTYVLYCA
jgi:rhodanese-related sulfurtransferase